MRRSNPRRRPARSCPSSLSSWFLPSSYFTRLDARIPNLGEMKDENTSGIFLTAGLSVLSVTTLSPWVLSPWVLSVTTLSPWVLSPWVLSPWVWSPGLSVLDTAGDWSAPGWAVTHAEATPPPSRIIEPAAMSTNGARVLILRIAFPFYCSSTTARSEEHTSEL